MGYKLYKKKQQQRNQFSSLTSKRKNLFPTAYFFHYTCLILTYIANTNTKSVSWLFSFDNSTIFWSINTFEKRISMVASDKILRRISNCCTCRTSPGTGPLCTCKVSLVLVKELMNNKLHNTSSLKRSTIYNALWKKTKTYGLHQIKIFFRTWQMNQSNICNPFLTCIVW